MNPHNVIADSSAHGVIGPENNANSADSPSSKDVPRASPLRLQVKPPRDESNEWLTIEQLAIDPGQARSIKIRSVAMSNTPGNASTEAMAALQDTWPLTLDEVIKQTVIRSLRKTEGNRRRSASMLGISRSTLYRMLSRYGIDHVGRAKAST
jgi:DNA-binding NtrC family response regulator